jgi:C_GCAxxG_C_C family probable redox protein
MEDRVLYAQELFKKGYVCSQAVFASFAPSYGIDEVAALKVANGFGGGIARRQDICGAVSGAIMLIGLKYGKTQSNDSKSHEKTYAVIENFCNRFEEKNKSIQCREILGCDMSTAKDRDLFSTVCLKCVRDSAEIISELLKRE